MNTLQHCFLELRRLLQSRPAWLVVLLAVLSPLAGLTFYQPAEGTTLSLYLANPAIGGGVVSGILFALFSVYELDRASRYRTDLFLDAAVSPMQTSLARILALVCLSLLTLGLAMLAWFPITFLLAGSVLDMANYMLAYPLFMGLAPPCAILAAASFYHLTRRADLSLVLFAAFASLSLTVWADKWQLCWLNPCVWALSDDFSNYRIFRSVAYMRLTWLFALSGVWVLSWCCIRQHGQGLWGSLLRSSRRAYRPAMAVFFLACASVAYAAQPMVDHSNPDETAMAFLEIPYLDGVVCTGRSAKVFPDTAAGAMAGRATYHFQNTSGQAQKAAFGINPGYTVSRVKANGVDALYAIGDYQEFNEAMLEVTIPAEEQVELWIEYGGFPQESRGLDSHQGSVEISGEYLCLENATLAPRLMNVLPDENKYPAAIEITLPSGMSVIPFCASEAELVAEHSNGTATWRYTDSGTGGILYAGDYLCQTVEAGGMRIEFYYGRKHQKVMESAGAVDAIRAVVDYCTGHYGPLSFGAGHSLKLIQSRVSGGGYATGGASLLDETDFTAANLGDSSKGAVPGEVMIHELVHQWWGLANMFDPSMETGPWSAEGLTVYTTYRIVKELYGEDYARQHYVEQWQREVDDYYLNFYVRHPEYLDMLPEEKQLEVLGSLTHVRQYCEMPLKLLKAEQLVGGETAMDQILHSLFVRDLDQSSPYLTFQNFLDACGLREEDLQLA